MKRLYGVITAMVTPFDENGQVMLEQVRNMVEFLVKRGVNCLYPCGTTGEMFNMTPEERELVAETVFRRAAGRVTVYIHVGAMTLKETVRLAQHAEKLGVDGIGVVTPGFFGIKDKVVVGKINECARNISTTSHDHQFLVDGGTVNLRNKCHRNQNRQKSC